MQTMANDLGFLLLLSPVLSSILTMMLLCSGVLCVRACERACVKHHANNWVKFTCP